MSVPSSSLEASPAASAVGKQSHPLSWVPTLYLAESLPFAAVIMVSVLMYRSLRGARCHQHRPRICKIISLPPRLLTVGFWLVLRSLTECCRLHQAVRSLFRRHFLRSDSYAVRYRPLRRDEFSQA